MLTSFFNKHRPVIFLIVAVYMAVFFILHYALASKFVWNIAEIGYQLLLLFVFLASMIIVDFISKKNDLTKSNTFKILLFAIFVSMIPATFLTGEVLLSNFFVLLGMRRIFSLQSHKDTQKKIYDAALWISLASCFYFWSFIFFVPLFIGIFIYAGNDFRNWLIPFVGAGTVIILANVYTLLVQDAFYTPLDWAKPLGFDFSNYNTITLLIPVTFILAILFWVIGFYFLRFNKRSLKNKESDKLILICTLSAALLIVMTVTKNGSEFLFLAMPFSVMVSNYLESPFEKIFKEILLWVLLIISFLVIFM